MTAASHINDPAKGSYGVGFVQDIATNGSILHDATGDHDDIFGSIGQFLDDQVHHLPEGGIFVLEEL